MQDQYYHAVFALSNPFFKPFSHFHEKTRQREKLDAVRSLFFLFSGFPASLQALSQPVTGSHPARRLPG